MTERAVYASPKNQLLAKLPGDVWASFAREAEYRHFPAGSSVAQVGAPRDHVYFPETGLVAWIRQMEDGQSVAVAWVGAEGFCNVTMLLGARFHDYSGEVLVDSEGYWLNAASFLTIFRESEVLRWIAFQYAGTMMQQVARNAACFRLHSKGQRVARWLLEATETLGDTSLPLTHETLAQVLGGPRHTATLVLSDLQRRKAVKVTRGRVVVTNRDILLRETCECYSETDELPGLWVPPSPSLAGALKKAKSKCRGPRY